MHLATLAGIKEMTGPLPTRRRFLASLSAAASWFTLHESLGLMSQPDPVGSRLGDDADPLIRSLLLRTAVPLAAMRQFYHEQIGFPVLDQNDTTITFAAGTTRLTFVVAGPQDKHGDSGRGNGEPMYHFAFNVPPDKIRAARAWQLQRTPLVRPRADLCDPAFPDDVWHFRAWDAHSIFYFDPAGNIVEYIARHALKTHRGSADSFTSKDLLYASEIGFVFAPQERQKAADAIHRQLGLSAYPREAQPWWAMGDERGLLLCLARKGQIWGEQTSTPVKWGVFPTQVAIRGRQTGLMNLDGFPYQVRVES